LLHHTAVLLHRFFFLVSLAGGWALDKHTNIHLYSDSRPDLQLCKEPLPLASSTVSMTTMVQNTNKFVPSSQPSVLVLSPTTQSAHTYIQCSLRHLNFYKCPTLHFTPTHRKSLSVHNLHLVKRWTVSPPAAD